MLRVEHRPYWPPLYRDEVTTTRLLIVAGVPGRVSPSRERIKGHLVITVPRIGRCGNDLLPPVKQPLRNIGVALHQSARGTSGGSLFHVPSLSLLVDACREVHHAGWVS